MPNDPPFPLRGKKVWVAGHRGMVGSALVRRLQTEDCQVICEDRTQLDLTDQLQTRQWIAGARPDAIFLAAAKVGGILDNSSFPVDYILVNLQIEINVIEAAARYGVQKLLFLGSSCIYPKMAPQPIEEDALLTGTLEPTNQWYAIAKIAGIKLGQAYRRQYGCDFISAMPTNLYGPNDNFSLASSHVLPALIRKAHLAKVTNQAALEVWGTGAPRREFLHVDDCADALVFLMNRYSGADHVNVGSGEDLKILELVKIVCDVVGFNGELIWDTTKPDGTPRKLMSSSRLKALGWWPKIELRDGIRQTYEWFLANGEGEQESGA